MCSEQHVTLPSRSCNVPDTQSAHADAPVLDVNVPGAHAACAIEPVEHAEPAGHDAHSLGACRPAVLE
jgi:hypothetical protein